MTGIHTVLYSPGSTHHGFLLPERLLASLAGSATARASHNWAQRWMIPALLARSAVLDPRALLPLPARPRQHTAVARQLQQPSRQPSPYSRPACDRQPALHPRYSFALTEQAPLTAHGMATPQRIHFATGNPKKLQEVCLLHLLAAGLQVACWLVEGAVQPLTCAAAMAAVSACVWLPRAQTVASFRSG